MPMAPRFGPRRSRAFDVAIIALTLCSLIGGSAHAQTAPSPSNPSSSTADGEYSESAFSDLAAQLATQNPAPAASNDATKTTDATQTQDAALPGLSDVPRAPAEGGGGGVSSNAVALPGGASSVSGLGESFTTQLSTGAMAFSVPFMLPTARGGVQPRLDLSYTSAGGFGIAGQGWNIGASAISRQTDRGVPRYDDRADWHPEQDHFLFGTMELVPICTVSGTSCSGAPGELMPPWASGWQHFRARVEGGFLRFFWSPDHRTWRAYSKEGASFEFGVPLDGSGYSDALQTNPDRRNEIYRWYMVRQYDSAGGVLGQAQPQPANIIVYRYEHDGGAVYLSDIYDTPPAATPQTTSLSLYAHHAALIYEARPDPVMAYKSGWLVEHALRLLRVDVTSKPFGVATSAARELVRRYHLEYDPESHTSLLNGVTMEGRCASAVAEAGDGSLPLTSCPRMPTVRFEYQRSLGTAGVLADGQGRLFEAFDTQVKRMQDSPPHSLDESLVGLMDVNSDGLPDVVATAPATYGGRDGLYLNGASGEKRFAAVQQMGVIPVGSVDANVLKLSNSNVSVLDLDADGIINLVHMPVAKTYSMFHPEKRSNAWWWVGDEVTTASGQNVKIDFTQSARDIQVMDVNGDGLVDIVSSTPTEYQTFFSLGRYPGGDGQFGHAEMTGPTTAELSNDPVRFCTPWSAEGVRFSDPDVRVADMNGDGLADIVRIRSGQILYWPGRGNGFWGTGDRDNCAAGTLGSNRHIEMLDAPFYGTTDVGTLLLNDVNADGFADLVEIRNDAVDVYLNDIGSGWTTRYTIENTPIRPPSSNYVRLTDIDGSGSPDILWGEAYDYRYIDLTGGVIPYLLTRVHNGLGGTTDFQYATSTDVMRAADAVGGTSAWKDRAPVVSPVLVQTTVRDNLETIGRPAGAYVTQYMYKDAVFEGRQREFRGFREAYVKVLGDSNSPTSTQRTVFQLGECTLGSANGDECRPESRWKDNWREALKGLPILTEGFDEQGVYLSTEHTAYELRELYTGRDGRHVMVSYPVSKESLLYDTDPAAFDHVATNVSVRDPDVSFVFKSLTAVTTNAASVTKRAQAGTARVRTDTTYDDFGNVLTSTREGCIEGCPNGTDESIKATSIFALPSGDVSGWLYRETQSYVTGSVQTARRNEVSHTYNAQGQLLTTTAVLSGTLALDRFHASGGTIAPAPPEASGGATGPTTITLLQNTYDPVFGRVSATKGPNGRCSSSDVDAQYQQVTIASRVYVGAPGADGCGSTVLQGTVSSYDRGLELVLQSVNAQLQPAKVEYDGFGRILRAWGPSTATPGSLATQPAFDVTYTLPSDPVSTPYSVTVVRKQDGTDVNTASYYETWSFTDGLGRRMAEIGQADKTRGDPANYIVGGAVLYNAKGGAARQYLPWFTDNPPASFQLAAAPPSNSTSADYDGFGRPTTTYGLDGLVRANTKHHALSQDVYDAADLSGPRAGTYVTVVSDGHGRGVQQIQRVHVGTSIEQRLVLNDYLPTGEVRRVIQRRSGSTDVVRWFRYDSLGRMVLNVEPNTSQNFNADPDAALTNIKALRYAYNDAGDVVGTSDARGCGVNFHYDRAGRLLAEDRSPCNSSQPAYTAPDLTTGNGTEAFYRYDTADPDNSTITDPAGRSLGVDTNLLLGRLVSVSDLGSKTVYRYDARGRTTGVGVRIVKPATASQTLSSRYAARWYVKTTDLDAMGRPLAMTTGVSVSQLYGAVDNQSRITFEYTKRGINSKIAGSYGTLLKGVAYTSEGLLDNVTLGDAASTQRFFDYDVNQRISYVETARAAPAIWSSPVSPYSAPPPDTSQLELEHYGFTYDEVGNIIKITDYRVDEDWPNSAKPVTREFKYDDLYRLTQAKYTRANGGTADPWTSPYAAENADSTRQPRPSPHVSFANRLQQQDFTYDWLGNVQQTTDNESGFWDRSLGTVISGTATDDPNQIKTASNRTLASGSTRKGDLAVASDAAGNYTDLIVKRDGPCLPTGASCWQRFKYDWNEVGVLMRARRWDLTSTERTNNATTTSPIPSRTPDAELSFAYNAAGSRTLKTAVDSASVARHTVYIFGGLELRSTSYNSAAFPNDYDQSAQKVQLRVPAGIATARILYADVSMPTLTSGQQHVFLELSDQIGSNTFVIDHATGELVEAATYQAYGATDADYRPGRWGSFREPFHFSGKEEDIELGLAYFGARYYSPFLGVWMSPDPLTIHGGGSDINPYAYVHGSPILHNDADGQFAPLVIVGIIAVSAIIAAGTSVAVQASTVGWDHIDWGLKGVAGAAIAGAVSGAVTAGAGSVIGGALGASSSLAGSLATSTLSGALGASASYVTSSALAGRGMSWSGFGKAAAVGGAGGLAGGVAGAGGSALANGMGGSQTASEWAGAVTGAVGGSGGGLATSLAFGDQITTQALLSSFGGGLAGALAGMATRSTLEESGRGASTGSGAEKARASAAAQGATISVPEPITMQAPPPLCAVAACLASNGELGEIPVTGTPADEPIQLPEVAPMKLTLPSILSALKTHFETGTWAFGVSWDATSQTWWGGSVGLNLQVTDQGLGLYWYHPNPFGDTAAMQGYAWGTSVQLNLAVGSGDWTGNFGNYDLGIGPVSGSVFTGDGTLDLNRTTGWNGVSVGAGVGAPFGLNSNTTYYHKIFSMGY